MAEQGGPTLGKAMLSFSMAGAMALHGPHLHVYAQLWEGSALSPVPLVPLREGKRKQGMAGRGWGALGNVLSCKTPSPRSGILTAAREGGQ